MSAISLLLVGAVLLFSGSTYVIRENGKEVGRLTKNDGRGGIEYVDHEAAKEPASGDALQENRQGGSGAGERIRVLFLGNSLTYMNQLPQVVTDLAKSRHLEMEWDMVAPGGSTLAQHAESPVTLGKIRQGTWDFVVLQEQSQMPALPEPSLRKETYPYAEKLSEIIRAANPRARVVFYETMAKENGGSFNLDGRTEALSYENMQDQINATYGVMARENEGVLAPVGLAWKLVRSKDPSLVLYGDEIHPNTAGTYLAACVFYRVFFNQSPLGLPHPSLSDAVAGLLQRSAEEAVSGPGHERALSF